MNAKLFHAVRALLLAGVLLPAVERFACGAEKSIPFLGRDAKAREL